MPGSMRKLLLSLIIITLLCAGGAALADDTMPQNAAQEAAAYLLKQTPSPQVGSIGGEWAVLGLARGNISVPQGYYTAYYDTLCQYLKQSDGVLHARKYSEYSRVILTLTALGYDPAHVAGYNLLLPLADYDKTVYQGINGAIYALLSLDSGAYDIPYNSAATTQATRELYLGYILERQLADGGWALSGDTADADVTGMALQALANYQDRSQVKQSITNALICLTTKKNNYTSAESAAQVIVALTALAIDPTDSRFAPAGQTLPQILLSFKSADGGFIHIDAFGDSSDRMATEQACCALTAWLRYASGKTSLYNMSDVTPRSAERNTDVTIQPVVNTEISFGDTFGHANETAILALASRDIISGMGDGLFKPDKTMTRAEFATIVVKALGLPRHYRGAFRDVAASQWYAIYIDTAYAYNLINGVGDNCFNPSGTITRQEATTLIARAAALCGLDTQLTADEAQTTLATFDDAASVANWARPTLAFCCREHILDTADSNIRPTANILRAEIAQMLYNMMNNAKLL